MPKNRYSIKLLIINYLHKKDLYITPYDVEEFHNMRTHYVPHMKNIFKLNSLYKWSLLIFYIPDPVNTFCQNN